MSDARATDPGRRMDETAGRIVHLNGGSSAGKTSIGTELQRLLPEPHLLLGLDSFIRMLPPRLFGAEEGWRFVPDGNGALRVAMGPAAERTFHAMYAAVSALSLAGNHVIFDDVMNSPARLAVMLDAWRDHDVILVGVRCAAEIAEAREKARGDRALGLARGSSAIVHQHIEYDIEVDTGAETAAACADAIGAFLRDGSPAAFARLRARAAV